MCHICHKSFLAFIILRITLLVSFSCSAQKNTTYPTERGIFDQNGAYKGDTFLRLDEIETLVDTIIAEGKRKRRHYVMQYPDGKGNIYRFGKSHKYAGLYWFNSYNRYQVYRGYYLDLEYKVPVNPSEIEFKRVIYKEHSDCPKAYILSFSSKEEKEDNKKRFIVIKDGTKEIVIDKLINRWKETPVEKDLIKIEEASLSDKEIIKALLLNKK